MAIEKISLSVARSLGLKRYYTGRPCKRGHVSERAVVNGTCIVCQYAGVKRWVEKNPDKVRALGRKTMARRRKDPEKRRILIERHREWRKIPANRDLERISSSLYKKNNKLKMCIKENRRRARIKNNGGSHTESQILNLLARQKCRCIYCPADITNAFQIDHRVPIALGGSNDIKNIDLLCKSCNSRKQAQDPLVWARKNGRLV